MDDCSFDVIIIGAGMAGISAACRLSEAGVNNLLILEATDRIGGRIQKHDFSGTTIEIGANWIEGVGGHLLNPLLPIADKLNLRIRRSDYSNISSNTYRQNGGLYPCDVVEKVLEIAEASAEFGSKLSNSLSSSGEDDVSVLASQRLFNYFPSSPLEMLIDWYMNDYEDAEPPRITSLKNTVPIPTFRDFGPNHDLVVDDRGYESIVHFLAKKFLKIDHHVAKRPVIKLNKVVREVSQSSDGVTVRVEDGSIYRAKYAVISASLGVLQSNLIKFKPDLPYEKALAISKFDMAAFSKIFLKFPSKFWPSGPGTEFFLYAHSKRGYYPLWKHFGEEAPGSNTLVVVVTDEEARRIELQPKSATTLEMMEVLRNMFGKDIPEPTDILLPKWCSSRFFRGSFFNWPTGVSRHYFHKLKAPFGRVYFTGEHTSELYNGFVHGAYLAGIDSANMILSEMLLQHNGNESSEDNHSPAD
ncbi:polyamine oxidase 1-like [Aristolochia californica]|uniref:polyamine oxidase 1-like n=1 Tax=Aristolochia californica TaxID=171875 RepID=UPI0035DD7543